MRSWQAVGTALEARLAQPREANPRGRPSGEVPEWSIGAVSKTVVRATVPWVRIPPSPPFPSHQRPLGRPASRFALQA